MLLNNLNNYGNTVCMQKEIKIEKIICIKAGNEDFRKLLLVCLSESVLVVDQNLKKDINMQQKHSFTIDRRHMIV